MEECRDYDKDVFKYCPTCGTKERTVLCDYNLDLVDRNLIQVAVTCKQCSRTWSMWFRYESTST